MVKEMLGDRKMHMTAFAILIIGLIAAVAGCTSSTGGSPSNASAAQVTVTPVATSGTPASLVSWFGAVTDSFGKPFEGVTVTLHLMNGTGEAYNMTTTSYVGTPYPGSYVFDNIEVTPDIIYAYAQAVGDVGDGVQYYGKTDNFTLNKSRMSSGFIVMHVPMPDAIKLTPDRSSLSVSGKPASTLITAQLYLNGKPYTRAGQTVNFTVDNSAVGKLPEAAGNVTDTGGRTTILLTGASAGNASVTGYMKVGISRNLSDACTIQVTG